MHNRNNDTNDLVNCASMILAIVFAVLVFALCVRHAFADETATATNATEIATYTYDYAEGESSPSIVDAQSQAVAMTLLGAEQGAALFHALNLQMAKYDRDMSSHSGRQSWHGRLVREEIHTNDLVKIQVYSNEVSGAVWRYKTSFKPVTATKSAARTVTYATNGIPARLAAARAARAAEINTGTVTTNIVYTAGGTVVEPVSGEADDVADTTEKEMSETEACDADDQ